MNREARLVQPGNSYKVSVSILGRDPPPKHHPTRTRYREQIAIPRGLQGVSGQGAVATVIVDELSQIKEEIHRARTVAQKLIGLPVSSLEYWPSTSSSRLQGQPHSKGRESDGSYQSDSPRRTWIRYT